MTHVAVRKTSYRMNMLTETVQDMEAGDEGHVIVAMNLREEEETHSEVIATIEVGTKFTVVEAAGNHRCLISVGNATGWISTKTDLDQPLVVLDESKGVKLYENLVPLNLREEEDFKSTVIASLPRATQFQLIEEGTYNRAKIQVDGTIGWITSKTDLNQNLIKQVGAATSFKPGNLVDNYVLKSFSVKGKAEKDADNTSAFAKTKSGRVVEVSHPTHTNAPAKAAAKAPEAKSSGGLKSLACCCGS